jgi:hypothetical protein
MILKNISFFLTLLVSVGTLSDVRAGEVSIFSDASLSIAQGQQIASTAVHSGQKIAQGVTNSQIVGKWQSDWGPVFFNSDLTGYWNQSSGTGKILGGSYNSQTRQLVFRYYQPWNNKNGTGTMTLSADGRMLSGNWTQGTGLFDSGSWTMTRGSVNSSVAQNKLPFKPTCAAMQQYYNTLKWEGASSVRFQGFEGMKFNKIIDIAYCNGGYITEISPMGTLICYGNMMQAWNLSGTITKSSWGHGDYRSRSSKSDDCRYK